ncbi:MAG TPA: nucleotide kinase domain-containing protein [Candidatus Binatia bacterium]|nr:nucleotide kinase domain-containing protein [Candidatus Binatia bacterium]
MRSAVLTVGGRLRATDVFDEYWRFAYERMRTFVRRKRGDLVLTEDPIIARFRFTNAYRVIDRVTQYLIAHVVQNCSDAREVFFRTLFFKIFNKIETWELLESGLGRISPKKFGWAEADAVLLRALEAGQTIYSAAYIMPSPNFGLRRKHENHLALLRSLVESDMASRWAYTKSLRQLYAVLRTVPSFGRFLAFQYAIDLNYSDCVAFDEDSFVVAGPGAVDGISKCFENGGQLEPEAVIAAVTEGQQAQFERLGLDFPGLYGRPLKLIDCQNLFCEISKYSRVSHPHVQGAAKRTTIKQAYHRRGAPIEDLAFPRSWSLEPRRGYEDCVPSLVPR